MEFFRHIVGYSQVQPTAENIQAILNTPVPAKKKKGMPFLESINFFGKFILISVLSQLHYQNWRERINQII